MSNLDLYLESRRGTNYETQDASQKLSDQAVTLAAAATTALAAGVMLAASRGRSMPQLIEIGETALTQALRSSKTLTRETFGLVRGGVTAFGREGASFADDALMAGNKSASNLMMRESAEATAPKVVTPGVADQAATSANIRHMELGARPAPQYAHGAKPIEEQYLGFIRKWPVEGVRVHPGGVDLYVTKNGHWLELKNFKDPGGRINGLDMLNTRISDVRVSSLNSAINGSADKPTTSVILEMGKRDPVKLTGQIKATEFWSK